MCKHPVYIGVEDDHNVNILDEQRYFFDYPKVKRDENQEGFPARKMNLSDIMEMKKPRILQ
jgi:hypothetical protein